MVNTDKTIAYMIERGRPFHGEILGGAVGTAAVAFSLFESNHKGGAAITLEDDEIVIVQNVNSYAPATVSVSVFDDANDDDTVDAGELIAIFQHGSTLSSGETNPNFPCTPGKTPKGLASGAVTGTLTMTGVIYTP